MSAKGAFIRAWRDWLGTATPNKNAKGRRVNAAAYEVEVALDHLDSNLYMFGLAILEGKDFDFATLASEELSTLDRVSCALEALPLSQDQKNGYDKSISASRALLEEILNSASVRKGETA